MTITTNRLQMALPELLTHDTIVIISACSAQLSIDQNYLRTIELEFTLKQRGCTYRVTKEEGEEQGYYEASFIVFTTSMTDAFFLSQLVQERFHQDCALVATHFGDGTYKAYQIDYHVDEKRHDFKAIGTLDWDYAKHDHSAFTVTYTEHSTEIYLFVE